MTRVLYPSLFTPPKNAPFPETVSVDRWLQPWSEPSVKSKPSLPAGEQQSLAAQPSPIISISWFNWLSEPVRTKPSLTTGAQQALALTEAAPFPEGVSEDRWHQPWSEPVRRATIAALQSTTAFTAVVTATVDGWGSPLSEPQRQLLGLPARQQQALALTKAAPFPETVSEDRWHQPWSEPVRPRVLGAHQQQTLAFVATVAGTVTEDSWHQRWPDPVQLFAPWKTGDNSASFIAVSSPVGPVASWATPWSPAPPRKASLAPHLQQSLALAPFVTPEVITEDKWHQRWTDPPKTKVTNAHLRFRSHFPVFATATPPVDGWGQPLSDPPKAKPPTAHFRFRSYFPFFPPPAPSIAGWGQPFTDPPKRKTTNAHLRFRSYFPMFSAADAIEWHRLWTDPIQLSTPWKTGDNSVEFVAAQNPVVPSIGYFEALAEPQRQLAGLPARLQQATTFGDIPRLPPFVFFFGNEEPLPWPGFRVNQFIRENYDQLALPPFPAPNPPSTSGKFTVSGPSVSDLFPVSGVVYPYAPETRKTVP